MPIEPTHDIELKEMMRQNLELTKEIHHMTKKIKGHITFQKVVSAIYLVIIVAPIVLSFIFLPPILKNLFDQYGAILGVSGTGNIMDILKGGAGSLNQENLQNLKPENMPSAAKIDINKLSPAVKAYLEKNHIDVNNVDINKLPPDIQKLLQPVK